MAEILNPMLRTEQAKAKFFIFVSLTIIFTFLSFLQRYILENIALHKDYEKHNSLTIDDWNAVVLFRRALDIKQKLYQIKRFHRYAIFNLNLLNNYS